MWGRSPTILRALAAAAFTCIAAHGTAHAQCADFNEDGSITAGDALGILRVATGAADCDMYHCDVDGSGGITAGDALRALKMAVGQSTTSSCPADPDACLNDMEFFFQKIWTPIQTDCVTCHNPDGIANYTRHILLPSSEMGYLDYNFTAWKNLRALEGGEQLLLTKPQGINHGGGHRLGITPDSILYQHMLELFDRFDNPVTNCESSSDFWADVQYMSDVDVLDKAAILFAARRPTENEIAAVVSEGETGLRRIVRNFMTGDTFDQWLMEATNDQLLTDKYLIEQSNGFGVLKGEYEYPDLYKRINLVRVVYGDDKAWEVWKQTNAALAREPLQLFVHVAKYERPYSEVLTADYMMVNPFSAPVYNTRSDIQTGWDESAWKEGKNTGYRLPNYEHAGILTSPMFLARFPSTATNRNRHRARYAAKFFLGVDIEKLARRTVDPAEIDPAENPTMNNPACTVCHSVMDPIAGTFQNFGDDGLFLEFNTDSLPWSYKETDLFHWGDRWYRDMRSPGFNGAVMPETENDTSLAWVAQQIANDPRFARGAVEFWYRGVFGRPPLERPTDPTRTDYHSRLNAWVAQDEMFAAIATKFADGTAGTGQHGALNLKDLIVELVLSPWFRASAAPGVTGGRAAALDSVGFVKLLTPEQLNRKFEGLTGERWAKSWDPDNPYLLGRYKLFYGGIDSSGITERATNLNALMSTVPQRMANEMACPLAVKDFSRARSQRKLFPLVDVDDVPSDTAGAAAIRANIAWLHYWLLGEALPDGDPEIERTFALFDDVWMLRTTADKHHDLRWGGGYCAMDFSAGDYVYDDEHQTIRSWIAVLAYLLSDVRFIYE
jgi:hypothetical protein